MAKKDFEIIPHHNVMTCWCCSGTGKEGDKNCHECKGTGKYIEKFYYIVYKGMCFGCNFIK